MPESSVDIRPEKIVAAARREAQETCRRAAARGRQDGLKAGGEAAEAEGLRQLQARLQTLAEKTRVDGERLTADYRGQAETARKGLTEQAFRLARKIVETELHRDDSLFLGLVRTAAAHLGKPDHLVLHAGPLGMTAARHYRMELEKLFGGSDRYEVCLSGHDDGLCVIETPEGSVDAGVETQLRRAARLLGLPDPEPKPLPTAVPPQTIRTAEE